MRRCAVPLALSVLVGAAGTKVSPASQSPTTPSQTRRRPRGRPRRTEPVVPTSVKIPVSVYDVYARRALKAGVSVHHTLVHALARGLMGSGRLDALGGES